MVDLLGHEYRFPPIRSKHKYLVVSKVEPKNDKSLYSTELFTSLSILGSEYEPFGRARLRPV